MIQIGSGGVKVPNWGFQILMMNGENKGSIVTCVHDQK